MDADDWLKENQDEIVNFINKAFSQAFGKFIPSNKMTGAELTQLIVGRLREIPQDKQYEMLGAYGLVNEFLATLMQHGVNVVRQKDCWWVWSENNTYFPVTATSALDPGMFILRPRGGDNMAKKKKAKKPKMPPGGGY